MSENFENPELNDQELKQAAGGKNILYYYHCEKCGNTWNTIATSSAEIPYCCGQRMKYYDRIIV